MTYHVDPKFLEVENWLEMRHGAFYPGYPSQKLTEEVLGISLKEKSSNRKQCYKIW